jgi:LAO/AO transport system kinase
MEVADLFVVNKADRPGADRLEKEIRVMMAIRRGNALRDIPSHHGARIEVTPSEPAEGWETPVLQTVAANGEGVRELLEALDLHAEWLATEGELDRRRTAQRMRRARDVLVRRVQRDAERVWDGARGDTEDRLAAGQASPYVIAADLHERVFADRDGDGGVAKIPDRPDKHQERPDKGEV